MKTHLIETHHPLVRDQNLCIIITISRKKKKKKRVHLDIVEEGSVLLFLGELEKIIELPVGVM